MAAAARRKRWEEHDFYDILGVACDASQDEIKRGFRKIALTCHPDKVREHEKELATQRFQLIAEAYEVLSKPGTRREYDEIHQSQGQEVKLPATKVHSAKRSDQRWQRCKGCFGRFQQKDLRRCAPACSHPVCFSCDSCSTCNKQPETKDSKEHSFIRSGMTFVAAYDACVFPAPHSWKVLYKIAQGTRVTVAGSPKSCDGDVMVPIEPKGWIDIVDLSIARKPEPRTSPHEPRTQAADPPPQPQKPKTGGVATAPRPDGAEVWTRRNDEDTPDLLRQASKLAQDFGDTAQGYVKTGYDGSAQVAQEAYRMAQAAGENAPWLAGEAMRMASEVAGRFWETATWAVRRSPSEISEESDETEKMTILTTMGFDHQAAEASLKRCSSIEAAVQYIMENSAVSAPASGHPVLPLKAVGQTLGRVPPVPGDAELQRGCHQGGRKSQSVQADLIRCGFSEGQAKAAARRCSSVEAAVEWIAKHPDIVT